MSIWTWPQLFTSKPSVSYERTWKTWKGTEEIAKGRMAELGEESRNPKGLFRDSKCSTVHFLSLVRSVFTYKEAEGRRKALCCLAAGTFYQVQETLLPASSHPSNGKSCREATDPEQSRGQSSKARNEIKTGWRNIGRREELGEQRIRYEDQLFLSVLG